MALVPGMTSAPPGHQSPTPISSAAQTIGATKTLPQPVQPTLVNAGTPVATKPTPVPTVAQVLAPTPIANPPAGNKVNSGRVSIDGHKSGVGI